MSLWDSVKLIPIDSVAARLGITVTRNGIMRCPFPNHNDQTPSFSLIRKSNGCWCHGCSRGGSVIDFVAHNKGITAKEAVVWLADTFRIANSGRQSFQPHTNEPRKAIKVVGALPTANPFVADSKTYAAFLAANPPTDRAIEYLQRRKISKTTIEKFRVGYIQNSVEAAQTLLTLVDKKTAICAGLVSDKGRLVFPSRALLFPFHQNGDVVYLQSRSIDENTKNRWMGLNGVSKAIYNTDMMKSAKEIYICEGCMDVLSAHELALTAIGLPGASTRLPTHVLKALSGKSVYILPDNDSAGSQMASQTLAELRKWGIQVVLQRLPQGKDLNDYLLLQRARRE